MERLVEGHFRIPESRSIISVDDRRRGCHAYIESMSQQLLVQQAIRSRPHPHNVSAFCNPLPVRTQSGQSSPGLPHAVHHHRDRPHYSAVPVTTPLLPNHGRTETHDETGFPYFPSGAIQNTRCALKLPQTRISLSECYRHDVKDVIHHLDEPPYPTHGLTLEDVPSLTQCPILTTRDVFTTSDIKRQNVRQFFPHNVQSVRCVAEPFQASTNVAQHTSTKAQPASDHDHLNFSEEYQRQSKWLYQQAEMARSRACPNIMPDIRSKLKSSLMSGRVTQVCGPPMAGKSNFVDQVIQELQTTLPNGHLDGLIYHSFSCKRLSRLDAVLAKVITTLQPSLALSPQASTETRVLCEVQKFLARFSTYHHVFAFHKCESMRSSGEDLEFVSFLSKLDKLGWSENVACSVVFTTYKRFSSSGFNTDMVQVGFLTDPIDIKSLLECHAPGVDVRDYIGICQKLLCVPEAVIRFAEEYLVDDVTRCSPQQLEKRVCVDTEFLSMIFEKRVTDVDGWLSKSDLELLVYFGNSINSTFTEQNLIEFLRRQINVYHFDQWVALLLRRLHGNHVLRPVPGRRLAVHPLLVYYVMTCRIGTGRTINDQSCNSFTVFVCHVLRKAEKNIRLHGKKGQVYGCLAQEWPHVRHVLELAINCTSGTYHAFLKVAIQARRLVMSCFPNESKDFYRALLVRAREYGTPLEAAVLEACLGHLMASGHDINWKLAEKHLDSAIVSLNKMGANYFWKWALVRKATILYKQGDYPNSLEYFMRSRNVLNNCLPIQSDNNCLPIQSDNNCLPIQSDNNCLPNQSDKIFRVSELQGVEDDISADILQTIPMIFMGDNIAAREMLISVLDVINDRCPDHPDLSILLNNIGLTEKRGNKDLTKALHWYLQAYTKRKYLEKICPHDLVVPLNNVAMCLFRLNKPECAKMYLEKALQIQKENSGFLYNLALTMAHLGQVNFKQKNFLLAYEQTLEAEETLKQVTRHHDFRLEVLMALVHYRTVLRQSPQTTASEITTAHFVKSAEEFLDYTLKIGTCIKERLSDEGQHHVMTAYEHGMVLSLGNSRDKFLDYKNGYLLFVQEKSWVRDWMFPTKEELTLAAKHRRFYYYVRDAEYEELDLLTCVGHMAYACSYCQLVVESYSATMWHDEIYHLMSRRDK